MACESWHLDSPCAYRLNTPRVYLPAWKDESLSLCLVCREKKNLGFLRRSRELPKRKNELHAQLYCFICPILWFLFVSLVKKFPFFPSLCTYFDLLFCFLFFVVLIDWLSSYTSHSFCDFFLPFSVVKVLLDLKLSATLRERERERERVRVSVFLWRSFFCFFFFAARTCGSACLPCKFQLLYILLYSWILEGVVHLEEWRIISWRRKKKESN
jgi:hypothetical protein